MGCQNPQGSILVDHCSRQYVVIFHFYNVLMKVYWQPTSWSLMCIHSIEPWACIHQVLHGANPHTKWPLNHSWRHLIIISFNCVLAVYFSRSACFSCKEMEDVGGGEGGGGHGMLLGNNNALLTDWKVSLALSPSLSLSWQDTACRCSATAFWIACCPGDSSRWKWKLMAMQGEMGGGGGGRGGGRV